MSKLFFRWLVTALSVLAVPHIISGVHVDGIGAALAVAIFLSLLNMVVRPILIVVTLPLTIVSLGLFILFINAFLFQTVGVFVSGFRVDSFGAAFLSSLFVSFVSWLMNVSLSRRDGQMKVRVYRTHRDYDRIIDLN